MVESRIVCNFSCGAASAVATKLAIERFGDRVCVVNAFVKDEDDDNRRFLADCQTWFGRNIQVLRDTKYDACAMTVWRRKRFIVNRNAAPCSRALKRDVLRAFQEPTDTIVLGFTADKNDARRLDRYIDANAETPVWAPLIEYGITKRKCFARLERAGIELPRMYRMGYHNANCIGCPKGGQGYWNKIRVDFPERYEEMASLQDLLGPGSYFFRDRRSQERISLRMLDPKAGRFDTESHFECGAGCEMSDALGRTLWLPGVSTGGG